MNRKQTKAKRKKRRSWFVHGGIECMHVVDWACGGCKKLMRLTSFFRISFCSAFFDGVDDGYGTLVQQHPWRWSIGINSSPYSMIFSCHLVELAWALFSLMKGVENDLLTTNCDRVVDRKVSWLRKRWCSALLSRTSPLVSLFSYKLPKGDKQIRRPWNK